MPVYSSEALVLRTYRYGEADRIVVFLTEDRGKKRGVAKHASASRRRFGAALEPLTRGRATYMERENRELVRLDRVDPHETPMTAASGREAGDGASVLGHASYFAELLDEWAPDASPNERLFRLGAAVGTALARPGSVDALARYFEYWLLRLEGVYPAIDRCPRCERVMEDDAVLVAAERAYFCGRCAHMGDRISSAALGFLRRLGTRTPADVVDGGAPAGVLRDLERAHARLIALHLEKTPRSARVVKELGHYS
ncbi:MAG: DNA repair protein RecO [Acidobacteriota bacterium]